MLQVRFRFYGSLNDFLAPERRQVEFAHSLNEPGAVKDTIEALGVPHPEVNLILVNQVSVGFGYILQNCDRISVYPAFRSLNVSELSQVQPPPLHPLRFVLDVHLGKLATYLRLLGFDTLYWNDADDSELAQISHQHSRLLLTQDRGLLKRSIVTYGYAVRAEQPEAQLMEVIERFQLQSAVAPLQRCPRCNGELKPVPKADIYDQLPEQTRQHYDEFAQCQNCQQVYWKGSHYARIQALIERVISNNVW